jgi:transposase InsO family protein
MPCRTSTVEKERARFVVEAEISDLPFAELCRRHGISRPTGYKWLGRYRADGLDGLSDQSRAPLCCPHRTAEPVTERVLQIRDKRGWGARKIHRKLLDDPTIDPTPCVDTVHQILRRNARIDSKKPRRRRSHPGPPLPIEPEPNATWTADFKGEFRVGNGQLCYPLTIQDGHTRFLLECRAMPRLDQAATMRSFGRLFREFGLPRRIRTDNGVPFASTAIAGLSQLSVWWITLGILPELIEPGKPQQNGRHERMHRTLKERTASPPKATLRAQQRRFNSYRKLYNYERPHEALDQETPGSIYEPSPRPLVERPAMLTYPAHFERRIVSGDSTLRWKSRKVFVSSLLKYRAVGLEQIEDQVWSVFFGPVHLGWLDEADFRIMDVKNRARRRR